MRQFSVVRVLAALLTAICLSLLAGCGGSSTKTPIPATIILSPTTVSLNEGDVTTISAIAQNAAGATIAVDITFTSSNPNIATISTGGSICGGIWDSSFIVCNATIGQGGVGQVTITASSGGVNATLTVYVHEKVDRVVVNPLMSGCNTMGQLVNASASAFSTSAPGCSPASPCDITSTVGPFTFASNNLNVVGNSAGVEATYSAATNSPTYTSGGTVTGSKGQTCNLSSFGVGGGSGINPTYSATTNSPTYTSGGTTTGSAGQTCSLSNFNGVTGATATVPLTGTNTITSGTQLTVTAEGSGATTAPTTATLSNGTATCSGTANVITSLIAIPGGSGVIGATATVPLTGTNTIASGTQLTVTASGYGATTPPTTATLSNGSATCSGTANVITALTPNVGLTAETPGSTTIFASVSGLNSPGLPYETCRVVSISVHSATTSDTSFTLTSGGTQALTADVLDTNGQSIKPPLTWGSSAIASATVTNTGTATNNPGTITAVAPGTAYITASCSNPSCNISLPPQYSLNLVTATVTGSTSTTVYAASTNSLMLVPISTSTNSAGTAITLPFLPNSMVADPAGATLYLGSSSGLMGVNLSTSAVSSLAGVNGTIEAISPDGKYLLLSDSVANSIHYFGVSTLSVLFTQPGDTTNSSAYTPDSQLNEWLNGNQLGVGLPTAFLSATTLAYTANALDISGQGGLTYISSSSAQQIHVLATCNQAEVQVPPLPVNSPTLIKAIPNGTGAVAADSPAIDVVTTGAVPAGCPPAAPNSVHSFDMGAGPFNTRQILLSPDSSNAWIISDNLLGLLNFNLVNSTPAPIIPFTGGVTACIVGVPACSGGITLDGAQVYVGASDGTVHRIDVASNSDAQQIAVGLKDGNGNPVAPNLVTVLP